tara:strand:- start:174 stop:653 length:480 start_codon:yes stop_codon:yes gene_type:complete
MPSRRRSRRRNRRHAVGLEYESSHHSAWERGANLLNYLNSQVIGLTEKLTEEMKFSTQLEAEIEVAEMKLALEASKTAAATPTSLTTAPGDKVLRAQPTFTCGICFESKTLGESGLFGCGHAFCKGCINTIRAHSHSDMMACPHCRVRSKVSPMFITFD